MDNLRETFRKYALYNQREGGPLFVDQARKLATELYTQTAAIAPTKATISAKVKSLGWRVIKRGVPAQWLGYAWSKVQKQRGRPSKAARAGEAAFLGKKPTLADMQKYVIAMRTHARLYLASGWLGAVADLGGSLKASSGKVDRNRGGATIRRSPGLIEVTFWNRTPGIETMDAKKQFVAKAIAVRTVDMWTYIKRKQAEGLARLGKAA